MCVNILFLKFYVLKTLYFIYSTATELVFDNLHGNSDLVSRVP
jgi:hypothetical protein